MLSLFAASASFNAPMSRRDATVLGFSAALGLAPAMPAFADADNRMYTMVKRPEVEQIKGASFDGKAVGLVNMNVDEWGSAIPKGTELGSTRAAADKANANKGIGVRLHPPSARCLFFFCETLYSRPLTTETTAYSPLTHHAFHFNRASA